MLVKLVITWALLLSASVWADVYVYTSKDGTKVYTDKPVKGAKKIKTTTPKKTKANTNKNKNSAKQIKQPAPPPYNSPYHLLRILFPYPDGVIEGTELSNFNASIISEPSLRAGHKYHLLINDYSAGEPKSTPVFELTDLPQGTYYLAAEILDEYGRILDRTPAQPVHVLRAFVE